MVSTPLHLACYNGHIDVQKYYQDRDGITIKRNGI